MMQRVAFMLLVSQIALAQDFQITQYDRTDGLSDNRVVSITQDSRGFMWFGTREGISRYNGKNFIHFLPTKNLRIFTREAYSLSEVIPGQIFFSSVNRLLTFDIKKRQFYQPDDFENRSVASLEKSGQRVLVGSVDTCFVFDSNLNIEYVLTPPLRMKGSTLGIFEIGESTWLLGSSREIFLYDIKTLTYQRLELWKDELKDEPLFFTYFDHDRQWLYMANYFTGIYRYSLDGKLLKHWPLYGYHLMGQLSPDLFWIGSADDIACPVSLSLNVRTDEVRTLEMQGKEIPSIQTSYTDRDGNIWLGTYLGVIKVSAPNRFLESWTQLAGKPIQGQPLNIIKGNDQNLYLSLFALPWLYRLNRATSEWELFADNVPGPWCVTAFQDEIVITSGQTMVYTVFDPIKGSFRRSTDFLRKYFPNSDVLILAFQHSNGDQWFSGNKGGGLVRISASDGKIDHFTTDGRSGKSLNGGFPYYASCVETRNGDLWFGVNKTWLPLRWSKEENVVAPVRIDSMQQAWNAGFAGFNAIVVDKHDNLWFGCEGSGIFNYNPAEKKLFMYTTEDGLASNFINSLQFDGAGRLWAGSEKGLNCLTVDENQIVTFTRENGLTDDRFTERCIYYDSTENRMWVGAKGAIMSFNPDSLLNSQNKPIDVYVDELFINGKRYEEEISTNHDWTYSQNNLQFHFAAVQFRNARIEYSYKLTGQDFDWVNNLAGTTASYANLEPGDYTFSVRVRYAGNNPWFTIQQPVSFTIATPWFKTWWFRSGSVAATVLVMIALVRFYYSRKTEKQKLILEKQQAVEKERTRIATDMHDDFGASLSRIKFISEKIKLKAEGQPTLSHDLTKISDYSDQMSEKMNEIVWALNERYDTLDDLVSFSRAYAAEYLSQHEIHFQFVANVTSNKRLPGEVRRNLFLVIKEALHNIAKHAQGSRVEIAFEQKEKLQVIVSDNGKGFSPDTVRPFANGISNMKKRIQDIGGQLNIINNGGTTIMIEVQI